MKREDGDFFLQVSNESVALVHHFGMKFSLFQVQYCIKSFISKLDCVRGLWDIFPPFASFVYSAPSCLPLLEAHISGHTQGNRLISEMNQIEGKQTVKILRFEDTYFRISERDWTSDPKTKENLFVYSSCIKLSWIYFYRTISGVLLNHRQLCFIVLLSYLTL